jgi:hypothetical protein
MPQVTVYIRKEDLNKWKALENKAAFISQHLNNKPNIIKKAEKKGSAWGLAPELQTILDKPSNSWTDSIPNQLEQLGYKHDPYKQNQAFDPSTNDYVSYAVKDGKVII